MLQNYLTTGLRSLARNRTFAAINILGLAIGMAACLLLLLYVRYERSYDQWLPEVDRAYQIQTVYDDPEDKRTGPMQLSAHIVGTSMARDFPEIERLAYASIGEPVIIQDGVAATAFVLSVDPAFLDIFQLPFVRGSRRTAFPDMNTMLLSAAEAAKRFPGQDPVGRTLTLVSAGKSVDYRITGILRDLPRNSHLAADILIPFNRVTYADNPNFFRYFGWNNGYNYVRLREGVTAADIAPRLAAWEKRNIPKQNIGGAIVSDGDDTDWRLTPVADVHLGDAEAGPSKPTNDPRTIATFALVAVLILAMACINFTNLATARAGQRAREVALRKVLGASRRQLIAQFLGESLLVATIAMLVALAIAELSIPLLADFLDADLALTYFGAGGILLPVVGLVIVVGLAAGLYPAFVLSRFAPAPVLKSNRGTDAQGSGRLRSALVVAQFAVSIALTICTAVVAAQTFHARTADAGYDRTGLLQATGIGRRQLEPVAETIVEAVARVPGVVAVGRTTIGINTQSRINTLARVDGNPKPIEVGNYNVDTGYFAAMGLEPIAGRNFSRNNPRDDSRVLPHDDSVAKAAMAARGANIMLNVEAVKKLGLGTPAQAIGKTIRTALVGDDFGLIPVTIIGVVPNIRQRSFRDPYEPIMYLYDRSFFGEMLIRVRASEAGAVRDRIESVWKRHAPQVPFQASFADDIVRKQYDADEARATTFAAFAGLAIIVACLGLYGLAAFTAERRTREIGIRKVLGARSGDIVRLLVWQFSRPVLLANFIAWPIAFFVMRDWLGGFTDRIDLGPVWFVGAGLLAATIAAATIIGHALKVARSSPAVALRYE